MIKAVSRILIAFIIAVILALSVVRVSAQNTNCLTCYTYKWTNSGFVLKAVRCRTTEFSCVTIQDPTEDPLVEPTDSPEETPVAGPTWTPAPPDITATPGPYPNPYPSRLFYR
jgi:hypothetical protein